jgi:biopolymer transport protein ExbD
MSWILRMRGDGRTYGPLDDTTVRRWAWDGQIGPDDELSEDGGCTWLAAGHTDVLRSFLRSCSPRPISVDSRVSLRQRRGRRTGGSLLDLTPIIDCVFLLLIFFFVTATFNAGQSSADVTSDHASADLGLEVSVPKVDEHLPREVTVSRQVEVLVAPDGATSIGGKSIPLDSLGPTISSYRVQGERLTVIVLASTEVKYGHIARAVAAIQASGIEQVLLGAAGPGD